MNKAMSIVFATLVGIATVGLLMIMVLIPFAFGWKFQPNDPENIMVWGAYGFLVLLLTWRIAAAITLYKFKGK